VGGHRRVAWVVNIVESRGTRASWCSGVAGRCRSAERSCGGGGASGSGTHCGPGGVGGLPSTEDLLALNRGRARCARGARVIARAPGPGPGTPSWPLALAQAQRPSYISDAQAPSANR
jgi:hypothetical protein